MTTQLNLFSATPLLSSNSSIPGQYAVPVFRLRLVKERNHLTEIVSTPAGAARLCAELLDGSDRERFLVVALSTSGRVIGVHEAHVGTLDSCTASPREVFKFALLTNARSVILCHNHPSGSLEPSRADVQVTKQMVEGGKALGIGVSDHLILGFDGRYTSLAQRGLL
ncbi:MAG: JAB domain-containing protein [Bacteroidota bacterium]